MKITRKAWTKYINRLARINRAAVDDMTKFLAKVRADVDADKITQEQGNKAIVDYAYAIATKYGEAGSAVACEMYDAAARLEGARVPPAEPAPTATYGETAKAVYGARLQSNNDEVVAGAAGRLVKQASADTVARNAIRDGAQWAWVPNGDTCAYCIMMASQGWHNASKAALKNGHAKHIHANCDCTYAVRFDTATEVEGYDPDRYYEMYKSADGATSAEKINAMRREFYAKNKDRINAQKRSAYAKRKELNDSEAEEIDIE